MHLTIVTRNLNKLMDMKSMKLLDHYAQFNPSPLSIKQFMEFGKTATEAESFSFLSKEIPVRLSNIMKEINLLPANLLQMPSILILQDWYAKSFRDLSIFESRKPTPDTLEEFCTTLKTVQTRHTNVVQTMAQGVLELKESHTVDNQTDMAIQYFLDRFYMSRISIRMLMHQHVLLFEQDADKNTRRIGIIDPACKVRSVIMEAFTNAAFLCEEYYNCAPDIQVKGQLKIVNEKGKKVPLSLAYPPPHLYHIMFELFKNSMRATVESHDLSELPPIEVLVAKGEHDVSIRISDQGGGIPRHITDHLFHYLFSTAPRPSMTPNKAPLAGYGYGLPLSRLYARYFHGDLILNSYDGYGTDAVVYMKTQTQEANELLPIFNKTSTKQYKSAVPTADWTDPSFCVNRGPNPRGNGRNRNSSEEMSSTSHDSAANA
eukprot:TRINITY_DN2093_c0_g1_i1.p1 TRINITY_DN2093_c0_g1~~TRINITY_DN2093_c0_g1_i1.p1  ORF type:complete len:431 (+),score=81.25 TRINITY_DN2093_c0_g1_i1:192-1484(+)